MDLALRILTRRDASELYQLHVGGFDRPWSEQSLTEILRLPTSLGIGVSRSDTAQLSGFGLFHHTSDEAELLTIVVSEADRRKGLARAILANGEKHLAARGCARMFLEVAEDNVAALRLYRQLDFQLEGRRRKYYARPDQEYADALIMTRVITGLPR